MKLLYTLLLLTSTLLSCTGDCLSCHPKLVPMIQDDVRHSPMLTCVNCHKPRSDAMAACGNDCFACHSNAKIEATNVSEHDVIPHCKNCHTAMKEEALKSLELQDQSNAADSLKSFLLDPNR